MANLNGASYAFQVEFPTGLDSMIDIGEDLRYIKERIQAHRAIYANEISGKDGELYEAGVGMMRLLWYLIRGARDFSPTLCEVTINTEETADNLVGTSIKMSGFFNREGKRYIENVVRYYKLSIPVLIEIGYNQYEMLDTGMFSIDISTISGEKSIANDGKTFNIPSIVGMIGTDYVNRIFDIVDEHPDQIWSPDASIIHGVYMVPNGDYIRNLDARLVLCIPANPNEALRYSENFPSPSMMMNTAQTVFDQIFYMVTAKTTEGGQRNNGVETDEKMQSDGERSGGVKEKISEEG